ncbi:hypothetical protein [Streptomyces sp. TE33382]
MRHVSAPVRWAAVTALTIAASAGCMSVGDDAARPGPSRSADEKGGEAGPGGGAVPDSGRAGSGGRLAHTHSDREAPGEPDPDASGATSSRAPRGPRPAPGSPLPTRGGHLPTPSSSVPGSVESPPPVTPEPPGPSQPGPGTDPDPEPPQPSEPSPPPTSASPVAQFRTDAMRAPVHLESLRIPEASPQVGPV